MAMDDRELSRRELMILGEIERMLDQDAVLARRLRTMRRGARPWSGPAAGVRRHRLALATVLLGLVSAGLFVPAVARSSPVLIWAFAVSWVLMLVCLLGLVCRWCRRFGGRS
ncbi:hypothetical protein [Streptomyces sp. NPDC090022]|uniref:hypothetical protein n=1 Tax=Streptomyces sp. NPDC090022 TaxID=3365920 RepID=UPI0037FC9DF2